MHNNEIKSEFNSLKAEALKIVENAKNSSRSMTAIEKAEVEEKFGRMTTLEMANEAINEVSANKVKDIATGNPLERKQPDTFGPLKSGEKLFSKLGLSKSEVSLGQFMRAAVLGPKNDAERFALANGSDSTGGFDLPLAVAAQFIDSVRTGSAYERAGALVVPMSDRQTASRLTADPIATWRPEHAAVNESTPFETAALAPNTLAVIARVSRESLQDSVNIDAEIDRTLTGAMARELDRAIGFGSGAGEPLGIANTPGVLEVTGSANGDTLTNFSRMLDAVYELQAAGTNPTAIVASAREGRTLNGFVDSTGQPLRKPDALNLPTFYTQSTPIDETQGTSTDSSSMIVADFSRLLLAVRVGLRIEVLKERYASNYEYGFLASLRMDSVVTRPQSFAVVSGIIPTA
jgi:HK97 family phage major capsid protein